MTRTCTSHATRAPPEGERIPCSWPLASTRTAARTAAGTSFILIVVSMLTLFAAAGMAYMLLYAMQEAKLGLARKDQEGGGAC